MTPKGAARSTGRCRSLRDWRDSLGLCQGEVAAWMGVSQVWVSQTEREPQARSKRAERLRRALLAIARNRLERARISRRSETMKRARQAWARLQEPDRGRLTAAMVDLVWEYLDSGKAEEADVIGLLMPGVTYRELLDEFFDETVERGRVDLRSPVCPRCSQPSLVPREGCDLCTSCGYSKCA